MKSVSLRPCDKLLVQVVGYLEARVGDPLADPIAGPWQAGTGLFKNRAEQVLGAGREVPPLPKRAGSIITIGCPTAGGGPSASKKLLP